MSPRALELPADAQTDAVPPGMGEQVSPETQS